MQVCLVGAMGKMGQEIRDIIDQEPEIHLICAVDPLISYEGQKQVKSIKNVDPSEVDVVIDFTNPETTMKSARWCMANKIPFVSGTTGMSKKNLEELKKIAFIIPTLWSPNMSLGVNLIDKLLPEFAQVLPGFSLEIVEVHHDKKADSPSGTAILFAQTLADSTGGKVVHGRGKGLCDERNPGDVFVHAMRGGTVPGEHQICFFGPDEVIKIEHRSLSRKIFARGAVQAAKWIIDVSPTKLYDMKDVLG